MRLKTPPATCTSLRQGVVAGLCLLLAACVETPQTPRQIAIDLDAVPGEQEVTGARAAQEFGRVCVDTAPTFAAAPARLGAPTYKQSRTTGTYFHQSLNLSFKLPTDTPDGPVCSMVFGSNANPATLAQALGARVGAPALALSPAGQNVSATGTNGYRVTLRSSGNKAAGHTLYNVFLRRPAGAAP